MAADEEVEEVQDAVGAVDHQAAEDVAEEENQDVDDDNAIALHRQHDAADGVGGEGEEEAGAVQGWDGDEVEEHEAEVGEDGFGEDELPDLAAGAVEEAGELADQEGEKGEQEVGEGAGESDQSHAPNAPFQVAFVDGHGFGAAENRGADQIKHQRHRDRHDRVDVFERVEGEAAGVFGGAIAEPISDHAVRKFVQNHGKKDDDKDNDCGENRGGH